MFNIVAFRSVHARRVLCGPAGLPDRPWVVAHVDKRVEQGARWAVEVKDLEPAESPPHAPVEPGAVARYGVKPLAGAVAGGCCC